MRRAALFCLTTVLVLAATATATAAATASFLFGNSLTYATVASTPAGTAEAFPHKSERSGTVSSVSVYVDSHTAAKTLQVGIYADAAGHPGAELSHGSLASPKSAAWEWVTMTSAKVAFGTRYWIALLGTGGALSFRDAGSTGCKSETDATGGLTALPAHWTSGGQANQCLLSAYVAGTVAGSPPADSTRPAISGTPHRGSTLTTTKGVWTGSPTVYTYQWRDCNASGAACTIIAGARSSSYTVAAADVGHSVRGVVFAANSAGVTGAQSAATSVVSAGGAGGAACTTTTASIAAVNAALAPGAVVCLSAGSYGTLTITAAPGSGATVTAAPGAHVVVSAVNLDSAANITVSQLHVTNGVNINAGHGDVIDHNDITDASCGYGVFVGGTQSGNVFTAPATGDVVSGNMIHATGSSCESDAIRIQGFKDLTISGNDVYNISDPSSACGGACHTDSLQSYQAGAATSGLTITRNYVHDTCGVQGFPFLKDGDISNVSITENLAARMAGGGACASVNTGISIAENTSGLVIEHNTNLQGGYVEADGSAAGPAAAIDHNVFSSFNVLTNTSPYQYSYTENWDVFTGPLGDTWSLTLGPNSLFIALPGFRCGLSCGNGTAAGDDYELTSNPNGVGIDWSPATQVYGPAS